ncbi:MFS transporter [Micromonospora sp. WMMD1128]|uniref:MFS transporter n=1 Tax=unclassified Micromonospora TaxID=2617518 RepID=UPI00248C8724|nr:MULTISPECIES: MFS transporter [unclassified Micromonospora]WBB74633.1 MFS transporter [Micromonospora sp. WMMD1128]WFE31996.1 MFS transporter [Micromonospora sp. WMMD975]
MRTVLRRPDFRLLFAAMVASMAAESILLLAPAVWVKDLTGSDGMAGATVFAVIAPMALAPLVGWVVDRHRRRPFFIAANLTAAVLLGPLFTVRDRDDVWVIYVVAGLYGLSSITVAAVLNGLIRQLLPPDLLGDANGALQTVRQGLRLIGPLAGAGIYAAVGGWLLAALAIGGFLTAAAVVGLLRVDEGVPPGSGRHRPTGLGAGLRHLTRERALRRALVGYGLGSLVMGFTESLIFAYVDQGLRRDAAFVAVLVLVQGIGGLIGGLFSAAVVRRLGELGTLAAGVTFFGPAALALAYPRLWLGVVALLLAGVSLPLTMVGLHTLVQRRTPPGLLGRVTAASRALVSGPQAASIGAGALLVGVFDYRLLFALVGVITMAAGLYLWRGRGLTPPGAGPARVPGPRRPLDDEMLATTERRRAR